MLAEPARTSANRSALAVADGVRAAELHINSAVTSLSGLTVTMVTVGTELRLPLTAGQRALERVVSSLTAVVESRAQIGQAHKHLLDLAIQQDPEWSFGSLDRCVAPNQASAVPAGLRVVS